MTLVQNRAKEHAEQRASEDAREDKQTNGQGTHDSSLVMELTGQPNGYGDFGDSPLRVVAVLDRRLDLLLCSRLLDSSRRTLGHLLQLLLVGGVQFHRSDFHDHFLDLAGDLVVSVL